MPADHGVNKAPAYQWYPRDFEGDELVKLMSLEEEGAYRRLLDHQWLHGSIPDDVRLLGKICKNTPAKRMGQIWRAVAACFVEVEPGRLQNRKMERVRTLSREHRDRQRAAGKLGAEARWGLRNPDVGSDGDGMATPLAGAMETPMASERPDHGSATAAASLSASATAELSPSSSAGASLAGCLPFSRLPEGTLSLLEQQAVERFLERCPVVDRDEWRQHLAAYMQGKCFPGDRQPTPAQVAAACSDCTVVPPNLKKFRAYIVSVMQEHQRWAPVRRGPAVQARLAKGDRWVAEGG